MKKITSLLLSVLMILSAASFTVFAKEVVIEEGNELAVAIDDVVVTDTSAAVIVPVTIKFTKAATGINGAELYITYDATKLTFDRRKTGWKYGYTEDYAINSNSATDGRLALQFAFDPQYVPEPLKEEGALINIGFTVVEGATGDVEFKFDTESTLLSTLDATGEPVGAKATLINGKVTLPAAELAKYDVTFATTIGTAPEAMNDVEEGTEITLPALADTDTHRFGGWSDGENTYTDKYTVNGDITLTAVWNEIVKYTYTFSEGAEGATVEAGTEITLPVLTDDELTFLGWAVNGGDEIVSGGTKYTLTGTVTFVARWKSAGKVYLSDNGADGEGRGLTADAPVLTLDAVENLIKSEEADVLVIVDYFTVGKNSNKRSLGVDKEIIVTGNTADAVFDYNTTPADKDDSFTIASPVTFKNIKINGDQNDGRITTNGFSFTAAEGVAFAAANSSSKAPKIAVEKDNADAKITLESGKYVAVYPGKLSSGTFSGKSTVAVSGSTEINTITLGHGFRQSQNFSGEANIIVNGGKVGALSVMSGSHSNMAANGYRGVRYFQINDGNVGNIYITDSAEYAGYDWGKNQFKLHQPVEYRTGLTIVEINKAGAVTGSITPATEIFVKEDGTPYVSTTLAYDDATRVVIYNNGSYVEDQVKGEGTYVLNVKNGSLKASYDALVWDGKDAAAVAAWANEVELLGFSYTLPAEGTFNAVKVGEEILFLADLEGGLIPAPEKAGVAEVEFINAFKVTIGDETTIVPEGETVSLTRLPQNGDLKHIGWATTEGADIATIDHTTEYTPTADVTLYPVWANAVYFMVSFVSAHGDGFATIATIDDDEDGVGDVSIPLPGYDTAVKYDDHFTFAGWATTEDGEVAYAGGDIIENLSRNMVLYAVWVEDAKANVTYRNESGDAPEAFVDYVGTEFTVAECPAVEGFEFLGWIADGETYQPGAKVTIPEAGITFTAKWGVKVAVDANGAKGELPVIGGAIGEEIDLPTSVDLTKVNNTFVGFALSADGEVITGKYTVNPDDTLYVIWEETVENAGIIETKVVYNSASGDYTVDMYFYGADANTVAFGYAFGENLDFISFTPAEDLATVPASLETLDDGYYAFAVTDMIDGKIEGADAEAGNGVHLGTIAFEYTLTKDDYSTDDAADNIAITAPASELEYISSAEYFLYTPAVVDLEVSGLPVVFDEAIEYETIDVVYEVTGTVKVVRADGTAPKNNAFITVYNEQGVSYKTFIIEDEETVTENGVFEYSIALPAGEYTLAVSKIGYATEYIDLTVDAQEGAGEDGFVPTPVEAGDVVLVPGDVVAEFDTIDLLDFAAITSSFGRGELGEGIVTLLDINEDGAVTVDDLAYVKANYGYGA